MFRGICFFFFFFFKQKTAYEIKECDWSSDVCSSDLLKPQVAPIVIGGGIAVLLFDAVGSLVSKQLGFSYALLLPGSLLIYGTVAALVARRRDWLLGLLAALAMGLTDLTAGWAVSWFIGAGKPEGGFTFMTVVGAVMTVMKVKP